MNRTLTYLIWDILKIDDIISWATCGTIYLTLLKNYTWYTNIHYQKIIKYFNQNYMLILPISDGIYHENYHRLKKYYMQNMVINDDIYYNLYALNANKIELDDECFKSWAKSYYKCDRQKKITDWFQLAVNKTKLPIDHLAKNIFISHDKFITIVLYANREVDAGKDVTVYKYCNCGHTLDILYPWQISDYNKFIYSDISQRFKLDDHAAHNIIKKLIKLT